MNTYACKTSRTVNDVEATILTTHSQNSKFITFDFFYNVTIIERYVCIKITIGSYLWEQTQKVKIKSSTIKFWEPNKFYLLRK